MGGTSSYKIIRQAEDFRLQPGVGGELLKCFQQCPEQRELDDGARHEVERSGRRFGKSPE